MGFFTIWVVCLAAIQISLHVAKSFTTEETYALLSRLIEVTYLQFGLLLGSWFFWTKRLGSLSLKVDCQVRKWLKIAFAIIAFLAQLAYLFFYVNLPEDSWLIYICFLSVAFFIHLIVLSLVFFLLEELFKRILPEKLKHEILVSTTLHTLAALFLSIFLTSFCLASTHFSPVVRSVDIRIKDLPPQFDGFSIALLTDIHIGPTVSTKRVKRIVEIVNNLNVDSVGIAGDLIDGYLEHIRKKAMPLKDLKSKHGVFFSSGNVKNHEYYHGNINALFQFLKDDLNLTVLHNENSLIKKDDNSICFAGVDDIKTSKLLFKGHKMDAEAALKGCPENSVVIMLVHQPNAAYQILRSVNRKIDLILSGHTHKGQFYILWPIAYIQNKFFNGLYQDTETNAQVYVSAGVNYWGPPVKISCEIVLLRLRA